MIKPKFRLMKYLLILTSGFVLAAFIVLATARMDESVEVRGEVLFKDSDPVFAPASGFLDSICVEEGELVKKDQILASLSKGQGSEKIEILSPAEALVHSIDLDNLLGGYVRKGEVLMVVSDPYQMQFRAMIPEKSIPSIEKGLEAALFIDAFPYQRFGTFTAVVTSISPMPESQGETIFYPTTLLIKKAYVESGISKEQDKLFLRPGMGGKARIITRSDASILKRLLKGFLR